MLKNTMMIGAGATEDKLRTSDGDILFATPSNSVLISDGIVYLNGREQTHMHAECVAVIRVALTEIAFAQAQAIGNMANSIGRGSNEEKDSQTQAGKESD